MNKKQLIVAWIMGISISFILIITPKVNYIQNSYIKYKDTQPAVTNWSLVLNYSLIILIIGGLLVYTFRDKK